MGTTKFPYVFATYRIIRSVWLGSAGIIILYPKRFRINSDIVNALMSFSIFTHIQAVMGADELEVRLIDIIETVLIVCLIHTEDTEVCKEREKTESGDRSCEGGRMMLLDPPGRSDSETVLANPAVSQKRIDHNRRRPWEEGSFLGNWIWRFRPGHFQKHFDCLFFDLFHKLLGLSV